MNKYDTKILEIAPGGGKINELLRRPVRSPFLRFVDMMFNNVLWGADGLSSKGTYYLLLEESKADLVHIDRNLEVSHKDVTSVIQVSANKRSFEFDGYRYKLYRKIR